MGACQSRKALKAAIKKRRMDKPTKGDRSSKKNQLKIGGSASPLNSSSPLSSSPSPRTPTTIQRKETKSRKPLKTAVKDTSKASHLQHASLGNKSRISSRDSSSPSLRTPLKTNTVSPAPNYKSTSRTSLTRFGFKNSPKIKNGDSTDSVNSILSDIQTDSNSNISDLCDTNHENSRNNNLQIPKPSASPISQASSGVTSSTNKCIKAQTKQLQKPQTIKTVNNTRNKYSSSNSINSLRSQTPYSLRKGNQSISSPSMQTDSLSRKTVPISNSNDKITRTTPISESSSKSIITVDSGLGSSSESDKLRLESDPQIAHVEGIEEEEDLSDAWLKDKQTMRSDSTNQKSDQKMEVIFNETSYTPINGKQMNGFLTSPTQLKECLKEKRDSPMTYGMARQKFAPYQRNRFGYTNTMRSPTTTTPLKSSGNNTPPGATKFQNSGVGSFVRSRIAQLEKTPAANLSQPLNPNRITSLKRPIRPSSFEKSPNLVTPVFEKTVELSRPICRKLEYTEETKNSKLEHKLSSSSITSTEDILMVSSVEKEKETPSEQKDFLQDFAVSTEAIKNEVVINEINFIPNKMSLSRESLESKSMKDSTENEKPDHLENYNEQDSERNNLNVAELNEKNNAKTLNEKPVIPKLNLKEIILSPSPSDSESLVKVTSSQGKEVIGEDVCSPGSESSIEVIDDENEQEKMDTSFDIGAVVLNDNCQITSNICDTNVLNITHDSTEVKDNSPVLDKCTNSTSNKQRQFESQSSNNIPKNSDDEMDAKEESEQFNVNERVKKLSISSVTSEVKPLIQNGRTIMTSSSESRKSFGMGDSIDRTNVSGKCTPTLQSARGDIDQDFLIDDEISDQPGLTFGDTELGTSFFDDNIFGDELPSLSPAHNSVKADVIMEPERSRTTSVCSNASTGGEDLMLDYDHLDIDEKGNVYQPEYEEDLLSPDASEIFNDWTAMMAEMKAQEPMLHECVTHDGTSSDVSSSPRHRPVSKLPRPRSSCSSSNGDLTASPLRHIPSKILRSPKKGEETEPPLSLDRSSYHFLCQDVSTVKNKLLQLKNILNNADTINPFDSSQRTSLYLSLGGDAGGVGIDNPSSAEHLAQQNVDLKRQVVLLEQQLEEKDRAVRLLQQQLSQALHLSTSSTSSNPNNVSPDTSPSDSPVLSDEGIDTERLAGRNAATQTDRMSLRPNYAMASLSRTGSIDDGLGPTVSSEVESENEVKEAASVKSSKLPTISPSTDSANVQSSDNSIPPKPKLTSENIQKPKYNKSISKNHIGEPDLKPKLYTDASSKKSKSTKNSPSRNDSSKHESSPVSNDEVTTKSYSHPEPPCTIHRSYPSQSTLIPCPSSQVVTH